MTSISTKYVLVAGVVTFALGLLVMHTIVAPKCYASYNGQCYQHPPRHISDRTQPNEANMLFVGDTKGHWVEQWYKWMLPTNPTVTFDPTGALTQKYQPKNSPVYFLAEEHDHVNNNRSITMHPKPIMFPALNALILSYTPVNQETFLTAAESSVADEGTHTAYAFLDGKPLSTSFVKTGTFGVRTYDYNKPLGDYKDGEAIATSQGYWGFVNPLSPGHHTLAFFGAARNYSAGATYNIDVLK